MKALAVEGVALFGSDELNHLFRHRAVMRKIVVEEIHFFDAQANRFFRSKNKNQKLGIGSRKK